MSSQEVSDWEKLVLTCPDAKKETAVAESRLCDLGGTKQHQYFLQRKLLKASIYDPFSFEEVFGKRSWQNKRLPAAAVYAIRSHSNQIDRTKHVYTPRYFEKLSLLEQMPLSSQGYLQLSIDLKRCEEFRTERLLSIDRFAVEETRSPEELVEVERMNLRLKQVYKAAKINAAKRKADKEKSAAAAANNIAEEDEEEDGVDAKNSSIIQKLPEDIEEDNEEDDENVQFDEDDEEEEIDVQEKEIRESFHDYCVEVANVSKISAAAKLLPIEFVPDALVRIFNKFISADLIKKGLERCGVFDESIDNLNLHEFRNLYKG